MCTPRALFSLYSPKAALSFLSLHILIVVVVVVVVVISA